MLRRWIVLLYEWDVRKYFTCKRETESLSWLISRDQYTHTRKNFKVSTLKSNNIWLMLKQIKFKQYSFILWLVSFNNFSEYIITSIRQNGRWSMHWSSNEHQNLQRWKMQVSKIYHAWSQNHNTWNLHSVRSWVCSAQVNRTCNYNAVGAQNKGK